MIKTSADLALAVEVHEGWLGDSRYLNMRYSGCVQIIVQKVPS